MSLDAKHDEEARRLKDILPDREKRFAFLYGNLSILDQKSSTLLAFNAIGMTAISVWLGYVPPNWLHLALDLIFLVLLASCALALSVVNLHWSTIEELSDDELQTRTLLRKRDSRTISYKRAWALSVTSVLALFVVSSVHTVGTFVQAAGRCNEICAEIFSQDAFGNLDKSSDRTPEKK